MKVKRKSGVTAQIHFSKDELELINNVLNEMANGIDMRDAELATRLGFDRNQVKKLLKDVNALLGQMELLKDKSKENESNQRIPDYKEIFVLAEQYSEASRQLEDQSRADQKTELNWGCSGPKLLVDSFAIELYLKCLCVQDTQEAPHEHDWEKIFEKLKAGTQKAILIEYNRLIDSDPIVGKPHLLREFNLDALKVRDFRRALKAARVTFDKKRYIYEQATNNKDEEWFYADFLRDSIRNVTVRDLGIMGILNKVDEEGKGGHSTLIEFFRQFKGSIKVECPPFSVQ